MKPEPFCIKDILGKILKTSMPSEDEIIIMSMLISLFEWYHGHVGDCTYLEEMYTNI